MQLINSLPETVFTTKVDDLLNWGRASSQWYMLFGLVCCAIELIADGRATRRCGALWGGSAGYTSAIRPDDRSRNIDL